MKCDQNSICSNCVENQFCKVSMPKLFCEQHSQSMSNHLSSVLLAPVFAGTSGVCGNELELWSIQNTYDLNLRNA